MKTSVLLFFASLVFSSQSFGSGCFSVSFYNTQSIAKSAGAESCYYEKLVEVSNPGSMADRQYNYFAEKLNEYVTVLGISSIDSASLEFMFYPGIRKSSLAKEDARKVDFNYKQTFNCYQSNGAEKKVEFQIYVYGVVGLTGVCLYKDKQVW